MMNWRQTTLVLLIAALSFGGSFECRNGDRDDDGVRVTTP
jgi:hypothetical protein